MIFIETNPQANPVIAPQVAETAAQATLQHQNVPEPVELTIVLTDDPQLQELNRQWMGIDAPTDVLSFPAGEYDPETGSRYLGDILISTAYAARQAAQYGHSPEAETQLLVIHGVLHLLGYDHAEPEEKERMWAEQTAILQLLGLGSLPVREE